MVTANKALLAEHGARVFAQARATGRAVAFEGSVGGGIPIVQALGVALAANQIQSLAAIVNGTCNFILTRMTSEGLPYDEALRQAQQLGYAEADPTLDVDGTDTAHKLAILAQLAFEANVRLDEIPRQGIDRLQTADLKYAGELGYAIKLLALAKLTPAGLELRVAPTLVRHGTPAGRGPRPLQRHPRGGRCGRRYPLLRPGRRRDADGLGRRRRPHRRRDRSGRTPLAAEEPVVGSRPGRPDGARRAHPQPILSPLHDRRPARGPGPAGADPGRQGDQHRQRHPARPRRRRRRAEPRARW